MTDAELQPLLGLDWPAHNHRYAQRLLAEHGWLRFAQGDWAYAFRSPTRRLVARVSPFECGYQYFVDLCRACPGNRHLPDMPIATALEGGGHLAVLEYLVPAEPEVARVFLRQWAQPDTAGPDLRALRRAVDAIDRWGRTHLRGWVGVDIGERHVLVGTDGVPKVIDLFGVAIQAFLFDDPAEFARRVPARERRYILDQPDLHTDHPATHLARVRAAVAALPGD